MCKEYTKQSLEEYLNDKEVDIESININEMQRILLIGFSIDDSLQRMIEWLSENYGVDINAITLRYIKSKNGEEFIARTVIVPEEVGEERRKSKILVSDEPGNYNENELKEQLLKYLSKDSATPRRIREILLPLCLKHERVSRDMIIEELKNRGEAQDEGKASTILTTISRDIGIKSRDFLRQVIRYDKIGSEKDNYRIEEKYKALVKEVLEDIIKKEERA
ncbi:MAG: hypothetical protein ACP5HX_11445 [Thermoproteota archaeon]